MIWRCNQPKEQLQDRAQQYERTSCSCSDNGFFALSFEEYKHKQMNIIQIHLLFIGAMSVTLNSLQQQLQDRAQQYEHVCHWLRANGIGIVWRFFKEYQRKQN